MKSEDYAVALYVMEKRHEMKVMICVYGIEGSTDRLRRQQSYGGCHAPRVCPALTQVHEHPTESRKRH